MQGRPRPPSFRGMRFGVFEGFSGRVILDGRDIGWQARRGQSSGRSSLSLVSGFSSLSIYLSLSLSLSALL